MIAQPKCRFAGVVSLGLCLALVAAPAGAQDREEGRKVAGMCRTCHGLDGVARIPIAPNIGGEPFAYLDAQLRAFRSGARAHEMMTVVAAGLSDQQIADVSAWYAAVLATGEAGGDVANAPVECTACHGDDGIALIPDAPNLAGETNIYIETQLKAFRSGKRASDVMSAIAEGLGDVEIRAAADWYGATRLSVEVPE